MSLLKNISCQSLEVKTGRFLFLLFMVLVANIFSEKLYVFYPSLARPYILQKELNNQLTGVKVKVFGFRYDFESEIEKEPPDAILSKAPLVSTYKDYSTVVAGLINGKKREKYLILSVKKALTIDALDGKTVGMLEILKKAELKEFVFDLISVPVKIKRVKKIEDLLSLLTFHMADAILIPESQVSYFKKTSKLDFKILEIPKANARIASFAIRKKKKEITATKLIKNLPERINKMLGVETWQ